MSDDRPKYACLFCQRSYRLQKISRPNAWQINCQYCLVTFYISEFPQEMYAMEYRLHDPVCNKLLVNVSQGQTWVKLHPKQKKIKNPPASGCFRFNTARTPKPKDALAHAQRLTNLLIFS